jgi:LAS superfamily LD-carboxypeptidase LdcB
MKKLTKKVALSVALDALTLVADQMTPNADWTFDEVKAKLSEMMVALDKKSTSTKPTKAQQENAEIKEQMLDLLASGEPMRATDVAKELGLSSGQKASALLNALEKAGEVVKRPGFSEHNSGLAVDLYGSGDTSLSPSFANTKAYAWLMEHCADYGFILRFPKGKESVTGVIYEAWHFRYVGDPAIAHAIMDNGLCLEEYLAQEKK